MANTIKIVDGVVINVEGVELLNYEDVLNYIASDTRGTNIEVNYDVSVGKITSITETTAFSPLSVVSNCSGVNACWYKFSTPSLDVGFIGAGDYSGPWDNRGRFETAVLASITWSDKNGDHNIALGSGTGYNFGSDPVIGRRVVL
ncbi:MAG: hypothetical protein LBC50_00520 [Candidatus Ancillula sp.]|nr:hypothetical protein [Candidatus Ancillula sp.]